MGQRIRKLMTMYKAVHPRNDTNRKVGGNGLDRTEHYVDVADQGLKDYIKKSKENKIQQAIKAMTSSVRIEKP